MEPPHRGVWGLLLGGEAGAFRGLNGLPGLLGAMHGVTGGAVGGAQVGGTEHHAPSGVISESARN